MLSFQIHHPPFSIFHFPFSIHWMVVALVVLGLLGSVRAQEEDFATWLETLRAEALRQGIRQQTLDAALQGVQPLPRVIELDRTQPETVLTYAQYIQRVLPAQRMQKGQQLLQQHHPLLRKIGAAYGVPPHLIVALWGIESDYGQRTGGFQVLPALVTLAYDGRRSAFFRQELLHALHIVDAGHVAPDAMLGSWAGAMGQNQFMPSSFVRYAVDHNGDGRRDIWTTLADVFASTAHYLQQAGWRAGETWGRRVVSPSTLAAELVGLEVRKSLAAWQELGVRRENGGDLPTVPLHASLVLPGGSEGPAFLVYENFRILLKWNRSTYFALAVGQLADHLRDP
jgi:membrane-bound lytic murein transglycosylase B